MPDETSDAPGIGVRLTDRFDRAVSLARRLHDGHVRKGLRVPYLAHLVQVAGIVLECGGNEEEAIAALLHDAAEDQGGEATLAKIAEEMGPRVAEIVRENSDSITESGKSKAPWRARKAAYIASVPHKSSSALLVSAADKLHNLRSLASDQRSHGDVHWNRFNATKEDSVWYYAELVAAFRSEKHREPRLCPLIHELEATLVTLTNLP
ncbi:MAG: HD domain-containing protein [Fimbriimonadaceae bacterium]|nr:HD domain-containing protein [Fimbriimonadaceae bacterium]